MRTSTLVLFVALLTAAGARADEKEGLSFPSPLLRSDLRNADPYILKVLAEHEREFPGALRHSHLIYYTPLARLARVQQTVLWDLNAQTDFAKEWKKKTTLAEIKVTVIKQSGAPVKKAPRLVEMEWNWLRSQWSRLAETSYGGEGS